MGPIGCPETSVRIYHYSPSNSPKERSSRLRASRRKPAATCAEVLRSRLNTSPRASQHSGSHADITRLFIRTANRHNRLRLYLLRCFKLHCFAYRLHANKNTWHKSAHNGRLTLSSLLHRKHTVIQLPPQLFHRRLKMLPCYPEATWTTYCVWQNSCWWYMYLPLSTNYEISPHPYILVARCGVITKIFCLEEPITSEINTDVRVNGSNLVVFKFRCSVIIKGKQFGLRGKADTARPLNRWLHIGQWNILPCNHLTSRSRHPEKLIVSQLIKKIHTFYVNTMLITLITKVS